MGVMIRGGARGHLVGAMVSATIASAAERARILVVDDDAAIVAAMQRELLALGLGADGCTSPRRALELAADGDYSVFTLDLCMPDMDGIALAAQLATRKPNASFLLVTGQTDLDLPRQDDGGPAFIGVLQKPWQLAELVSMIGRAQLAHEDRALRRSHIPIPGDGGGSSILLVEDNRADADFVEHLLQQTDLREHALLRAERLSEAERMIRGREPVAIITDLSLPDARGIDAIVRLRTLCPSAPFVVLSGVADDALVMQAMQEGAQEVVLKADLNTATLLRALRHAAGRAHATEALRERAERDSLTGLLSRQHFESRLAQAVDRAKRERTPLSVLYVDLDRFKPINDHLGHSTGDEVLREAGRRISTALRETDAVGRVGGDEMVALLENTSSAQALALARRVRSEFERSFGLPPGFQPSASVGVATYPEDVLDPRELLSHADFAMYRAKQAGRGVGNFDEERTSERPLATLLAAEDQVARGLVSLRSVVLHGIPSGAPSLVEVVPGPLDPSCGAFDPEALRRISGSEQLTRALYERVVADALALDVGLRGRVLVGVSEAFCRADGALAWASARAESANGRLCIGLPQRWLQGDHEAANEAIARFARVNVRTFITDFGAQGADLALLSRLFGLRGACLDGHLLRELAVDDVRVSAFVALLEGVASSLELELVVRAHDAVFCRM